MKLVRRDTKITIFLENCGTAEKFQIIIEMEPEVIEKPIAEYRLKKIEIKRGGAIE